jgi:hypothetical protein
MSTKKVSKVWNFFQKLSSTATKTKVKCLKCEITLSRADGSTSSMAKHLLAKHNINVKLKTGEERSFDTVEPI